MLLLLSNALFAKDIRIALLAAHKGAVKGLSQWQATADFLSKKIPEHRFIIVPFENNSSLNQAISLGKFHFCITNPASGVEHQIRYGAEPLATLVNKQRGKGYSKFGSVIFTRADRDDVNTLQDTKGNAFIGADELGFGGWRIAWNELLENNINPYKDYSELRFAGGKQQDVIYAVRDKKVATGVVRTGMLEQMSASGKIKLSDFKVINAKKTKGFPFSHSTKLYPEWMFSVMQATDKQLKTKVVKVLLSIHVDSQAALKGKYIKWIKPLDYSSVNNLLQKLKVGPYNIAAMGKVERFFEQYGSIFFTFAIILILLVLIIFYVLGLNKKLSKAQALLKLEMDLSKKLERQLLHSQRVESLGHLTGGIAHDFNNMLASIIGFTELSLGSKEVKSNKKLKGYLKHVITASEKCTSLVNQMLTFSRTANETEKKEELSVSLFLTDIHNLALTLLPSSFKLTVEYIDKSLFIDANPVMLNQVLMNLYLNAKDAINDSHGKINLSAEYVNLDALNVFCDSCHQDIRGKYVAIRLKDNGAGIDNDIKDYLFDPFFSTKEVGKGTGMGLSVAHGIVHEHGGHITIDSKVNQGTTINIFLPFVKKEKTSKNKKYLTDKINGLNKNIVIIDDEVSITIYLGELLSQYGYKINTFNDSKEALQYISENKNDIDLVLSDQTMPNLTGIELSKKIFKISKEIPVIICSGYSNDFEEQVKSDVNIKVYMEKPINSDKLLAAIDMVLK